MALNTRANAAAETNQTLRIPLTQARNADGTAISAAASAGKFGMASGGVGVGGFRLEGEAANNNTKTSTLLLCYAVPQNFNTSGTKALEVLISHKLSAVAATTATVDVEAYKSDKAGGVSGSDLCTTAAQAHNSGSLSDLAFTIDPSTLSPGDELIILVTSVVNDAGGAGSPKAYIGGLAARATTRM